MNTELNIGATWSCLGLALPRDDLCSNTTYDNCNGYVQDGAEFQKLGTNRRLSDSAVTIGVLPATIALGDGLYQGLVRSGLLWSFGDTGCKEHHQGPTGTAARAGRARAEFKEPPAHRATPPWHMAFAMLEEWCNVTITE